MFTPKAGPLETRSRRSTQSSCAADTWNDERSKRHGATVLFNAIRAYTNRVSHQICDLFRGFFDQRLRCPPESQRLRSGWKRPRGALPVDVGGSSLGFPFIDVHRVARFYPMADTTLSFCGEFFLASPGKPDSSTLPRSCLRRWLVASLPSWLAEGCCGDVVRGWGALDSWREVLNVPGPGGELQSRSGYGCPDSLLSSQLIRARAGPQEMSKNPCLFAWRFVLWVQGMQKGGG